MTVKDFLESIGYDAEMKELGEMKNFRYYIQVDLPNNQDEGIPLMIIENISKNIFEIASSDQTFAAWEYFGE